MRLEITELPVKRWTQERSAAMRWLGRKRVERVERVEGRFFFFFLNWFLVLLVFSVSFFLFGFFCSVFV